MEPGSNSEESFKKSTVFWAYDLLKLLRSDMEGSFAKQITASTPIHSSMTVTAMRRRETVNTEIRILLIFKKGK